MGGGKRAGGAERQVHCFDGSNHSKSIPPHSPGGPSNAFSYYAYTLSWYTLWHPPLCCLRQPAVVSLATAVDGHALSSCGSQECQLKSVPSSFDFLELVLGPATRPQGQEEKTTNNGELGGAATRRR